MHAVSIWYIVLKINDYKLPMVLNVSILHSHLPCEFMFTLIIPILKDKNGDVTSKENNRPIALISINSKVLKLVIISKYCDQSIWI